MNKPIWKYISILAIIILAVISIFISNDSVLVCHYEEGTKPSIYYFNKIKHQLYDKDYKPIQTEWNSYNISFYDGIHKVYINSYDYSVYRYLRSNYTRYTGKGQCTRHYFKRF